MRSIYSVIEDSGIVTEHDKEINEEFECSEFYINGRCHENTKLIFETINIDSEDNPYYFYIKLNENGNYIIANHFTITERLLNRKMVLYDLMYELMILWVILTRLFFTRRVTSGLVLTKVIDEES